jgi:hypothetical protein
MTTPTDALTLRVPEYSDGRSPGYQIRSLMLELKLILAHPLISGFPCT